MTKKELRARKEKRKEQAIEFIRKFSVMNGYCPSRKEIAAAVGVNLSSAQRYIVELQEEGKIEFPDNKTARAIVLKVELDNDN